jgi:hypothetical protein
LFQPIDSYLALMSLSTSYSILKSIESHPSLLNLTVT